MNKLFVLGLVWVSTACLQTSNAHGQNWGRQYGANLHNRDIAAQMLDRTIKHALRHSDVNVNLVHNRANGVGQRTVVQTPVNKRININLFKNSGNGSGNEVIAGGVRGGYNLNILKDSGVGSGNDVYLRGGGDLRHGININVIRDSGNGDRNRLRAGYWR